MAIEVRAIPDGFHTLTPHMVVRDAARAIEFYKQAFDAEVRRVAHDSPDGKITHAELRIGNSMLLLCDEFPDWSVLSPQSLGGSAVTIHMYLENVDSAFERAVSAGCTVLMPLADQFWGDRYGIVIDPFGHRWSLATHIQDRSAAELKRDGQAAFAEISGNPGLSEREVSR
jgi:uncharacterized glyoxalase superfamily protein PhnB